MQKLCSVLIVLTYIFAIHGMENKQLIDATLYNNGYWLSEDMIKEIFTYSFIDDAEPAKSLEKSIKHCMVLRKVCKKFNTLLSFETIAKLCKRYNVPEKNKVLQKIVDSIYESTFQKFKLPLLILVSADADARNIIGRRLLEHIVYKNEIELAQILFQHNVDSTVVESDGTPIFFNCETITMAQLFIEHGVNVHAESRIYPNILWKLVGHNRFTADLIKLYLAHNVNPRLLFKSDRRCLLHMFADIMYISIENAKLILAAMPDMINHTSKDEKTPIDIACESLEKVKKYSKYNMTSLVQKLEALIELYKNAGALRSIDLDKNKNKKSE